uniref:Uncharacterized protein n=1 Tax=Acrobeloides nanus TaxID=290746 RepID=A0A914E2B6_9BILA
MITDASPLLLPASDSVSPLIASNESSSLPETSDKTENPVDPHTSHNNISDEPKLVSKEVENIQITLTKPKKAPDPIEADDSNGGVLGVSTR